jgi:hypothetical protein
MPLYTYVCPVCDYEEEALCKYEQRNAYEGKCPADGQALTWRGVEQLTLDFTGNASGRFQMRAVTSSGEKVAGHFGKQAKNK